MNINEVRRMQAEKDHLMNYEGKHPANYNEKDKEMFKNTQGIDENYHGVELL